MKVSSITVSFAAALLGSVPSWAADLAEPLDVCAVSQPNGKVEAAGGYIDDLDDGGRFQGAGSLSFPLGCLFGAQLDVGGGSLNGDGWGGVGGHLFMRDPASYLVGAHVQYENLDGEDIFRIGPEAELYFGNVTLTAWAGYEDADTLDADVFAAVDISLYATEDLKFSVGYRRFLDIDAAALGAEWQLDLGAPLSLFAEAQLGSDDYSTVLVGARFYFGAPDKSLIQRHREDDPPHFFNLLREVGACGIGQDLPTNPTQDAQKDGLAPTCVTNPG